MIWLITMTMLLLISIAFLLRGIIAKKNGWPVLIHARCFLVFIFLVTTLGGIFSFDFSMNVKNNRIYETVKSICTEKENQYIYINDFEEYAEYIDIAINVNLNKPIKLIFNDHEDAKRRAYWTGKEYKVAIAYNIKEEHNNE